MPPVHLFGAVPRLVFVTVCVLLLSEAGGAVRPGVIPPPRPPQEPILQQAQKLDVVVQYRGAPRRGVNVTTLRLLPGGRLLPSRTAQPALTDAAGRAELDLGNDTAVVLSVSDARGQFLLRIPLSALDGPIRVGAYEVTVRVTPGP